MAARGGLFNITFLGHRQRFWIHYWMEIRNGDVKKQHRCNKCCHMFSVHFVNEDFHVFVVYVNDLYWFVLLCKKSQLFLMTSKTTFLQKTSDVSNDNTRQKTGMEIQLVFLSYFILKKKFLLFVNRRKLYKHTSRTNQKQLSEYNYAAYCQF